MRCLTALTSFALVFPAQLVAGEAAQQRQVERFAESVSFPSLIDRCIAMAPAQDRLRTALTAWQARRNADIAAGLHVVTKAAEAQQQTLGTIETAIRTQALARFDAAAPADQAYTCERLQHTLAGTLPVPLSGDTRLDEDSQRELFDELLPVGRQLMQCEAPEALQVTPGPPPLLRPADTATRTPADAVEIWTLRGCGKALPVEVSLRFFPDDPPAYSMAFPRRATPLEGGASAAPPPANRS